MTRHVLASDPDYLKAAFSVVGLSEIEGARHEAKVLAMYAASGHPEIHDDETPWCAAYIGWSLTRGGRKGTNSLLAISYAKYGVALDRNAIIPRGAIAVWKRTGGNHVNFVIEDDGTYVTCLGGNQSNGKGGGVTISRRLKAEALAFRMPADVAVPLPKSKPKPAPIDDSEQPEAQEPVPTPPEPKEDADKPGFFRRIRNRVVGATGGIGGFSFLTYMTDWQIALIFFATAFVMTWSLIWFLFWLFGKDAVRDWIRKQVGR